MAVERPGAMHATTLVGRQRELDALRHAFLDAAAGRARVLLLAGEPGIGKTRLLDACAAQVAADGAPALRGGAFEAEGMPPYLPFLAALGPRLRATAPDLLRAQIGDGAAALATLFPELPARLGTLPASYPLPPEQARLRLFEAVADYLAALAEPAGLALLLDDLHWSDPASFDLLCHVVRHRPEARLLLVGAYREGEGAHAAAFARAEAELSRLRVLDYLRLAPLDPVQIADVAATQVGGPLTPAAARLLAERSEGNPFFAEELARGWLEAGVLTAGGQGWQLASPAEPPLPRGIVGAIEQRLARLSPDVVELLEAGALAGRIFDVEIIADAVGRDAGDAAALLDAAERARLVRRGTAGELVFSHDRVRECLAARVNPIRQRRLHGLLGRALEARAAASPRRLAELAYHYARSGDGARGAAWAVSAGDDAARAFAHDDAVAHYQTALDLSAPDDARRGAVLLRLGVEQTLAGAEDAAADTLAAAERWFDTAGDGRQAALAAQRLGQALWRREQIAAARDAFERAVAGFERLVAPELGPALVELSSLLAVSLHDLPAAIARAEQALELAPATSQPALRAAAMRALGNALVRASRLSDGIALLEGALNFADAADAPAEAAECCAQLALAYAWRGAIAQSRAITERRLAYARRSHDAYELRHIYTWLAVCDAQRGRMSDALRQLGAAQQIVERLGSPEPRAYLNFCLAMFAFMGGELESAERLAAESVALFRRIGPGALVWYLGSVALIQATLDQRDAARATLAELRALIEGVPPGSVSAGTPLVYVARAALELGDDDALRWCYPRLEPFAGDFHDALVDWVLADIEVRRGALGSAEARLAAAERTARAEELVADLARTLAAQAELALARGGRGARQRANQLLNEAEALLAEYGIGGDTARAVARRRALTRPALQRQRHPAGLTAREVEVLRLVAAGHSNRDIATELSLSEKTIENHLTHVYTKIGADNRAAAVAFAIRHDLA
jgi:DNA-binding NarL/FixJ family response regulator/tetratricopeptide (TPR) repeat protein